VRTYQTVLETVYNQIVSTKNLSKITSSMKMVSAAKLKGDENRLAAATPFNSWAFKLSAEPELMDPLVTTYEALPAKCLLVPFTTDKGLCGGVNSYVTRSVKDCVRKMKKQGKECDILVIGDKGRAQLRRECRDIIVRSATDIVQPGNFSLAAALTSEIIAAGAANYDAVVLMYNSFKNKATYLQKYKVITKFVTQTETEESLSTYEFDSDKAETMQDLYEYMLASQVFHSCMDAAASEQSSRMTAMENASQNANDMVSKLTLKYNRARQSRITTELIEIISGASAIDS
jgi:F-type H+-transporting ATPase subunit gamma